MNITCESLSGFSFKGGGGVVVKFYVQLIAALCWYITWQVASFDGICNALKSVLQQEQINNGDSLDTNITIQSPSHYDNINENIVNSLFYLIFSFQYQYTAFFMPIFHEKRAQFEVYINILYFLNQCTITVH